MRNFGLMSIHGEAEDMRGADVPHVRSTCMYQCSRYQMKEVHAACMLDIGGDGEH